MTGTSVSAAPTLFDPIDLGELELPNRILMAPLTRNRARLDRVPTEIMQVHYAQRASAGLIVSEGIHPSAMGCGYDYTPGLYTAPQIDGWRAVTDAVHAQGGRIFAQLMHNGRLSFSNLLPDGAQPVAPSAVAPDPNFRGTTVNIPRPYRPYEVPRALETDEVVAVIEEFRIATVNAFAAGFDGVEIHGGSGYLPMQFHSSNTNVRNDRYGGSVANRCRFMMELVEAMSSVRGPGRIAVKLSPGFRFHDIHDADPVETYSWLARHLSGRGLAYLSVTDTGEYYGSGFDVLGTVRPLFDGVLMAASSYTKARGNADLREGRADMIGFGTGFIANPDLPLRFLHDLPLQQADAATFYTQGAEGYIDYPFWSEADAAAAREKPRNVSIGTTDLSRLL